MTKFNFVFRESANELIQYTFLICHAFTILSFETKRESHEQQTSIRRSEWKKLSRYPMSIHKMKLSSFISKSHIIT